MHFRTLFASALVSLAALGRADPVAVKRQNELPSVINSYASKAGSYYSEATAAGASWYSEGLSDGSTWLDSHSGVIATVTSIAGVAESIVTSVGGPAITLASNGVGVVTSFAGSEYTVLASPTSTPNAAVDLHPMSLTASPVLTALVTVAGGALLGAWLTY